MRELQLASLEVLTNLVFTIWKSLPWLCVVWHTWFNIDLFNSRMSRTTLVSDVTICSDILNIDCVSRISQVVQYRMSQVSRLSIQ